MTQTEATSDDLADELENELPDDFHELEIEQMVDVVDDVSDRYQHRELHFLCTGTEILVIYDRENDDWMQIEREPAQ
jgi:hypothetical protein